MPKHRPRPFVPFVLAFTLSPLVAQEGPPKPAPEVQKFAPMLGNWQGTGDATFGPGTPPVKWTAHGTYRWCLDGHWLQEDFRLTFEGAPNPLVLRSYYGWDRESQRHVALLASNNGQVHLNEVVFLPDGTMLQITHMHQEGLPYSERSRFKVDGDKLTHSIDLLMPEGPSLTIVDGRFTRADKAFDGAWETKPFEDVAPTAAMVQFGKSAGEYRLAAEYVMVPGAPAVKITGTDTFRSVFGGTVMYGTSAGTAEGMPGQFRGDVFWAWDAAQKCLVAAYVGNMGEVAKMSGWFAKDGKLITTHGGTQGGEPMVSRMVMEMDADGRPTKVVAHTLLGDKGPFESYRATYTRK